MFGKFTYPILYSIFIVLLVILVPTGLVTVLEKLDWSISRKTGLILCFIGVLLLYLTVLMHLERNYRKIKLDLTSSGYFLDLSSTKEKFHSFLAGFFGGLREYVVVPVDNLDAAVVITDECKMYLTFKCNCTDNLLIIKRESFSGAQSLIPGEMNEKSVGYLYRHYPEVLDGRVLELMSTLLQEVFFEKISIKAGVMRVFINLSYDFELVEGELLHDLVSRISKHLVNYNKNAFLNLETSQLN